MNPPIADNSEVPDDLAAKPVVKELTNRTLKSLSDSKIIVFPAQLASSDDLQNDNYIFKTRNNKTWTCNVAGFLGNKDDKIRIISRFTKQKPEQDYFLQYMLETVLNYNVVNRSTESQEDWSDYDLLAFLFPYYLNIAIQKGVYKEYVQKEYNDPNIKGAIDFPRHIRTNNPFIGNIAYRTREFSYDNKLTQLIRHTIEKIHTQYPFVLTNQEETITNVRTIRQATPDYSQLDRNKVLQTNIFNPIRHGYFQEYSILQQWCIRILSEEKSGFGNDDDLVHGIIIDVAWLWEEYIAKVTGWDHYGRKNELLTAHLFAPSQYSSKNESPRYPDFVLNNIPIDTKYKVDLAKRNDYNQMTTYIHILKSSKGGFLQPTDGSGNAQEKGYKTLGILNGFGGKIFTYGFYIPQSAEQYNEFVREIKESEKLLIETIKDELES
jgi:5-methylcytosine-specific restriction endonuclease McrBC regulatory subunit McrC